MELYTHRYKLFLLLSLICSFSFCTYSSGSSPSSNAPLQARWEAGAQRTLAGVGWTRLILIEAPSSAYRRGMLALGKQPQEEEETSCDSTPSQHQFYCGIDLHARSMYVCILDQAGEIQLHQNMKASPEAFLRAMTPDRADIVVAVECLLTWYWRADLCAQEGIPFVLGHALSMKAIHGGKAKHDTIDAHKMAVWLRGGMLPQAYVYPADMRATRDRLRRRMDLTGNGRSCWRTARTPPARTTYPRSGNSWPPKPTATVSPSGSLMPPCRRAWKWTWRCLGAMTRCSAISSSTSSTRRSSTTPTSCICSRRCPESGTS